MVLVIASISNLAFYVLVSPGMVGMSGVIFGLISYTWAYYRINPNASKYFEVQIYARYLVMWCLICFFLKLTNIMRIANVSHTFGALAGMILGYGRAFLSEQNSVPFSWLWTNQENRQAILLTFFLTAAAIYVDRIGL